MKLLKTIVLGFIAFLALSACSSEDNFDANAQFELDKKAIKNFASEKYPNAIADSSGSGIYYELISKADTATFQYKLNPDGSHIFPTATVNYRVLLLNGSEVDGNQAAEGFAFGLKQLIPAWHRAFFPKPSANSKQAVHGLLDRGLQPGDHIRFITPSAYAYGDQSRGSIPANSPLIFEIKVLKIVD